MAFADRLRAIRLDRGFKQKDVAAAIGISEPNYSMYEHGTREPGISKLTKLANVLNVSTDYLLLGKKDRMEEKPSREEIFQILGGLDDTKLIKLAGAAKILYDIA